ncbi:hypothetical protein A1F94_008928 [Pyrenophora tritici-repentis]|uniref:Uncharacterized protein n=2 Tax=Pyrenophora tritici-repentis TaxID=45151 RepID=A0A2W1GTJ2_9PLEO|nr:uncharacterized protein PTRG_06760 [Pyrenophora tritici-repentis Pt-1C-BFP]KAF7445590.1 hypothetical protein A1F99_105760 [Pyrenophora tritici-repentis]EDU49680.1 predicted protein [Pyrenophora tritici-repentis Pt-1C-BFP]KAF7565876.1 hypothetical protein PtrM4_053100 [Pyrenophora tritici-repentis]KAG9380033.1 hypothetical protein A1F94_008928 [Pyrenophora tritici-repentis]KAI1509725.1 hypothetical protein Ptr86124_011311 [Pyrenophora tritici-repentis]
MSAYQHPGTPKIIKRPFGGREIPGEPLTKRICTDQHIEKRAEAHDPKDSPPLNLLHFSQVMSGLPPTTSKKGKERARNPVAPGSVVDPHDLDTETLKRCFERDMKRYRAKIKADQVLVTPLRAVSKLLIERPSFGQTRPFIDESSKYETKQSYKRRRTSRKEREKKSDDVLSRRQRPIALKADIMAAIDLKVKQNREHQVVCGSCDNCPIAIPSEQHNPHISDMNKRDVDSREDFAGRLGSPIDLSICSDLLKRTIPDEKRYQDDLLESSPR